MKRKYLTISISIVCLIGASFTEKAFAGYCCPIPTIMTTAKQTQAAISMSSSAITSAIGSSTLKITQAIGKSADAQSKIATDVKSKIADQAKKNDLAKEVGLAKTKAVQRYQLPPSVCNSLESSSKIVGTREIQKTVSNKLTNGLTSRNLNTKAPKQAVSKIYKTHIEKYCGPGTASLLNCKPTSLPDADINVDSVLAGAGLPGKTTDYTFAPDQEKSAKAFIKNVTDPIPDKKIPPELAKPQEGKTYIVKQLSEAAKMSLAAKPFIDALAWRTPVAGLGTQIQRIWKQAQDVGISVPKEFLQQFKGKTAASPLAFLRTEIDRRAGNSQWYIDMVKATPEARLTENTYIQALELQLRMEELTRLEKIEMLLGGIYAQAIKDSPEAKEQKVWYAQDRSND